MEQGESFDEAVKYCQGIGIAETDPSGDVDGWDAAVKVSALATVLMDSPLKPQEVERKGIREITPEMVDQARGEKKRWKLVASAERIGDQVSARVAPEKVDSSSPLYGVMGSSTGLTFRTDVLPDYSVTISEREGMQGGPEETAYGLFADFVKIARESHPAG
jgi:homoserine dehydrogenase